MNLMTLAALALASTLACAVPAFAQSSIGGPAKQTGIGGPAKPTSQVPSQKTGTITVAPTVQNSVKKTKK